MHGHQFDNFIEQHPIVSEIADYIYHFLQKIDKSHNLARYAKRKSKKFQHCINKIEQGAINYAKKMSADIVCCGHTHQVVAKDNYFNSGCWTEKPCTYLEVKQGEVYVCEFKG